MALCEYRFFGDSIGLCTSMTVILPDTGRGPFPVFYLMHGLTDDHSMWLRRTSIERYVAGLPLIVVMPTTHRGWYTNAATPPGLKYEDHIIKDVIGTVERVFPAKKSRGGRAIGGLSMGGYGSVKLALKYPEIFCSVTSHSGVLMPFGFLKGEKHKQGEAFVAEFHAIFGNASLGSANDPTALARKCPKSKRPAMRIDCGTEDYLVEQNRAFHRNLENADYAHEYAEYPGAHDWDYWDTHVQEAIAFHRKALRI